MKRVVSFAAVTAVALVLLAFRILSDHPISKSQVVAMPARPAPASAAPSVVIPSAEKTNVGIAKIIPALPEEGDDEMVVDWDPVTGGNPKVVFEQEQSGYKVMLNEAGMIQLSIAAETGEDPEKIFSRTVPRQLLAQAQRVARERLPMIPRSEWSAKQEARQAVTDRERPVDPEAFGYDSLDAMKAAYRKSSDIPEGQDFELLVTENEKGEEQVSARVTRMIYPK